MSDNLFDRQRAALARLTDATRGRAAADAELNAVFQTASEKAEREVTRARKVHAAALAQEIGVIDAEHAEEKVETVRRWIGRLPKMIDEMFTGPSRRLKSMLEADLPNAQAALAQRIASLESYAGLRPDYAPGPSNTGSTPPAPLPEVEGGVKAGSPEPEQSDKRDEPGASAPGVGS